MCLCCLQSSLKYRKYSNKDRFSLAVYKIFNLVVLVFLYIVTQLRSCCYCRPFLSFIFHSPGISIFFSETLSSSLHDVFFWNVARCTLAHSDARTACILTVWDSQKPPNATSHLTLRQLCVRMSVVLWWGVGCAQLRVIIWWWARAGKTCGLRSSGHAAHPQPANQHRVPEVSKVQGTYNGTLWYSITRRPHQNTTCPNIADPKKILAQS